VGLDADDQIQVAARRPGQARLAFAGDANAQAVRSSDGYFDLDLARVSGLDVA
jgi:hypothetical protein